MGASPPSGGGAVAFAACTAGRELGLPLAWRVGLGAGYPPAPPPLWALIDQACPAGRSGAAWIDRGAEPRGCLGSWGEEAETSPLYENPIEK